MAESARRHPHVVNQSELEAVTQGSPDERFLLQRKKLGEAAGGRKLGCSLIELPPGKRSWPFHCHLANEEAIFVLNGGGTLRIGAREVAVGPGDYIAFPPGLETAHLMTNTSDGTLRYLCISTMIVPEVALYPDSDKIGVLAGVPPGGPPDPLALRCFLPRGAAVDYWQGE
jgi:uncharacterized cupin superfamily protein